MYYLQNKITRTGRIWIMRREDGWLHDNEGREHDDNQEEQL